MKKTKIVCTIGPSSESEEVLSAMFKAGLNVCRLNFSHGTHEEHQQRIDRIKKVSAALGLPIGIMLDTKGPEIRLGIFDEPVQIVKGQEFLLTTREIKGTVSGCSISYRSLAAEIKPGNRILINDGLLELKAAQVINETDVLCTAVNSGVLSSKKGVNIPGIKVNLPYMSEKDIADIEFGIKNDIDFIAASFTQNAGDILQIKKILEKHGSTAGIIAKIENQEGLDNIDGILQVADGLMVARGDLGVEIEPERIPHVQKILIKKANVAGKPVITATQMLESMTHHLRPTRAEVTDVANAILDGTSAVMLSGETAAGDYPVETVAMMHSIACTTEKTLDYGKLFTDNISVHEPTITNAISRATCSTALALEANAIITASASGLTPRAIAKFKPKVPIIVVTESQRVMRKLSLDWDVYPVLSPAIKSTDNMFDVCSKTAKDAGYVKTGETVIITAGIPIGKAGSTNLLKVQVIE